MNRLDVLAIILLIAAAVGGWWSGLVRRLLSWAGLLAGLWVGSQLLPRVVGTDTHVELEPAQFLKAAGVLVACAVVGHLLGRAVGGPVRSWVTTAPHGKADQGLGALAGVVGVVLLMWIVLPAMASVPGWTATSARESAVAQLIDDVLGRPPSAFDGISRSLGLDRLPNVFDDLRPSPGVASPPPDSTISQEVLDRALQSVVKVTGPACGRIQAGSGSVVGDDLIVTNAHVVAGVEDLSVETTDGRERDATVVAFDPRNDLALLSAPGLGRPVLELRDSASGDVGVALGFPGGGDLAISPFRIEREMDAVGRDIYGDQRVDRTILVLAAELQPGDSGGALLADDGRLIGVAFAVAPDQSGTAYGIRVEELQALLAATTTREPASVGGCAG